MAEQWLTVAGAAALGLVAAWLIRRAVMKLPEGSGFFEGPATCATCGEPIPGAGGMPGMGRWLYEARGECAHEPREWELWTLAVGALGAAALAAVLVGLVPFWAPKLPVGGALVAQMLMVGWFLYALGLIDGLTLTVEPLLVALGLIFRLGMVAAFSPGELGGLFLSSLAAAGAFHLVALFYELLRGKEGLGQGDASVMALIGACVGLAGLPVVVLLAALGGLALAMGRRMNPDQDP